MAISNGRFTGEIEGKTINDYSNKLDYSIDNMQKRKQIINETLNLDDIGSREEFWIDIWDMATCKTDLNKSDTLWTDTNIANLLESMGTYLIAQEEADANREKKRFSRPKKETSINGELSSEDYVLAKNDKNYRLAPPDEVKECDFKIREVYSKDYSYYKDVLYVKYIDKLKNKIIADTINRYGYHDGTFDEFSCGILMDEDKWNNLKRLEIEKVRLLNEAKHNLDILKNQNKQIQDGSLYFHPFKSEEKQEFVDVYKYDFINRITPCHKQLEKSGYNNLEIKRIEEECLYKTRTRSYGVGLRHITENISDIKDYMLSCKLAHTNRIYIAPDKNSVNTDILDHVDYADKNHIEAILYMQGTEISYENDMSIISYDITKAIKDLKRIGKLDDKDIYIIEGIRHRVTQENIAKELGINESTIWRRMNKIVDKIKNFW